MHDKVVLITGAARRIGAQMARTLHNAGASIVVHYRRSAGDADQLAAELNHIRASSAVTVGADLNHIDELQALAKEATQAFGRIDALINNASSFYPTPVGSATLEQWDDLLGSNLRAPFFLSQALTPQLSQHNGSILNITDIHATRPLAAHPIYCAAKAGLVMLTQSLAKELGPQVRVNGIAPGPIMWPEDTALDDAAQQTIIDSTLLKRHGEPSDIASTALFLLRDADFVTGQILAVDGGRSLRS